MHIYVSLTYYRAGMTDITLTFSQYLKGVYLSIET